jgi:hypothetical protein
MKIILFITVILFKYSSFAFGNPERTKKCALMSVAAEQIVVAKGGVGCLIYKDKSSQAPIVSLKKCPLPFKNKYVYIWSNLEKFEFDHMEIRSSKNCDQKYYRNLRSVEQKSSWDNEVNNLFKEKLKEKDPLTKITKLHFFRIRTKDKLWTYHYSPGVSVDIEVTGEMCDGKLCMDEKKQKFSKVLKTYIDFIWMDDNNEVYYSSALDASSNKIPNQD